MKICLYGAASPTVERDYMEKVEAFGRAMALRGHSLVFGGGKQGLMGAAARGVHAVGGHVMGVIPKFFGEEDIEVVYLACDELVETDTMRQRKQIMEENADAFVVVPGGIGTYEEFFEILTLKQLGRHNKPIVLYNINGYYNELNLALEQAIVKNFVRESCRDLLLITEDADAIFSYLEGPVSAPRNVKELKDG